MADARQFWASESDYRDRGIPYHRGYLFSGPPRTGKSSLADVLASLSPHRHLISLPLNQLSYADFLSATSAADGRVLLLEDCDTFWAVNRREQSPSDDPGVGIQELLNVMDGVMSPHGALWILTTNHPERLDPALVQPGRVDRHWTFDLLDHDQARRLYLRFRPNESHLADAFAADWAGHSPAEAERWLLSRTDVLAGHQLQGVN